MNDAEFFQKLGGSTEIDLTSLFGPEQEAPSRKSGPTRAVERTQPETMAKMAGDLKEVSRLINEFHATHLGEIEKTKSELQKKIDAQKISLLRDELGKLSSSFENYVKNSKNRVETRIDYRETNRLDAEIKGIAKSLEEYMKAPPKMRETKIEVRVDEKEMKEVQKELKHLKKLLGEVGKYEYGSSLNVFGNSNSIGFTGLINFKNGTNTTAVVSINKSGGIDVEIDATGGGGFTTLLPTETPNGSLQTFTFSAATAKPSFIISDNAMMRATAKNGDVNWTWNSGAKQATMTIPPTDDIVGVV